MSLPLSLVSWHVLLVAVTPRDKPLSRVRLGHLLSRVLSQRAATRHEATSLPELAVGKEVDRCRLVSQLRL